MDLDMGYAASEPEGARTLATHLADAELGLSLHPVPELSTQLVVVQESGVVNTDQAWACWSRGTVGAIFGLAPLDHGIYATHLIGDPWLQEEAETILPAVGIALSHGIFRAAIAAAARDHVDDSGVLSTKPLAFPTIELAWGDEGLLRLSGKVGDWERDLDLALRFPVGSWTLDLEGIVLDGQERTADAAYLAGIAWRVVAPLELAVRADGRRALEGSWSSRICTGATASFAEIAMAGVEWSQEPGEPGQATARLGVLANWRSP